MQIDVAFRVMWADHGDEVSMQYAGTGAVALPWCMFDAVVALR